MTRPRALINGFGRIGRLAMRRSLGWHGVDLAPFDVVWVNEVGAVESAAYLLQFDSTHSTWGETAVEGSGFTVTAPRPGGGVGETVTAQIGYSRAKTPGEIPFADTGPIDLVLECSGEFLTRDALQPFFDAGARAVVVAAPVKDAAAPVLNVVYGVNHDAYDPAADALLTAASCTTNCLAPVVKVLQESFGIVRGAITTIHDLTNTQSTVDATNAKKDDLRRARSALCSLVPTSTGSATAIALIFPELKGKLNGLAIRVPLLNASLTDGVFELAREVTAEEVNAALEAAAASGPLAGILGFEARPLVSADYVNDTRSAIVDAACTQVIDGRLVKIYMWYQNELGYACRFVDVAAMVARKGLGAA